ncbi:MAG: amidohydrolase family protein [Candidatus Hodarchaeota archaeon]
MIDNIKIFDSHMHYIGKFKKRDETLIDFLDRFGIDKAVVITLNKAANKNLLIRNDKEFSEKEYAEKMFAKTQYDHEEIRELIKKNSDRLVGVYWFNPRIADDEDWKILKRYIKDYNFKGVKIQASLDNLKIPKDLFQLAEFCIDFDLPLFFHFGPSFFFQEPFHVKDVYSLVKKYRELKCVVLHAAYTMEYCVNCLRYFPKCSNVYFETSLSVPYGINILIKVMGNHRVLYGSDSPAATTPDIEINKIRILNLDNNTLESVFYNNISNLIGET